MSHPNPDNLKLFMHKFKHVLPKLIIANNVQAVSKILIQHHISLAKKMIHIKSVCGCVCFYCDEEKQ